MDEARRFLRYVTPGIVVGVEALLLSLILVPWWVWEEARQFGSEKGLAAVGAAFFASGGLGYMISVLHHSALWSKASWYVAVDHTSLIVFLLKKKYLELRDPEDLVNASRIKRESAWHVTTALWRSRESRNLIKSATPNLNTQADLMHSAGASVWGALAALCLALLLGYAVGYRRGAMPEPCRWAFVVCAGTVLICVHWRNYRRLGRVLQFFMFQILSEEIARESRCKGTIVLSVDENAI